MFAYDILWREREREMVDKIFLFWCVDEQYIIKCIEEVLFICYYFILSYFLLNVSLVSLMLMYLFFFFREFQAMASTSDNSSLSSD